MYYKLKSKVIFREYDDFGYITDNGNFGYNSSTNTNDIGDLIVSKSGAVFLSALSIDPQTLNSLISKIHNRFSNVSIEVLSKDARDFYNELACAGFVISGDDYNDCISESKNTSIHENKEIGNNACSCGYGRIPTKATQDFFNEYFGEDHPQLTNIHMEITSLCNERCIHCYVPTENKNTSMDLSLALSIIKQCRDMNVLHITLTGGEPMMHKDFIPILTKIRELNFSVNVLSNLTLLNDVIIKEMVQNKLLGVQTSIYSLDSKVHDSITKMPGSLNKTLLSTEKLLDSQIPVQISCPIMKQNKDSYYEVVEWGSKHGLAVGSDYVIIAKYNHATDNLNHRLSAGEVKDIICKRISLDSSYSSRLKAARNQYSLPSDNVCSVCYSSICINERGIVYPCAGWQDYPLGNANSSTLYDIWNNSPKVNFLRNIKKSDFPQCISCEEKDFCTMCMVRNANEDPSGNPFKVNPFFCEIAQANKEIFSGIQTQ